MLEQTATVVAVQGHTVWLETQSRSACAQCSSGHCETATVASLFGTRHHRLQLPNHLGARPGDRVVIGVSGALLARASLWGYLVPLLVMIVAALAAKAWGIGDGGQSLLALAGLLGGLYAVRQTQRRYEFQPELLRLAPGPGSKRLNPLITLRSKTS